MLPRHKRRRRVRINPALVRAGAALALICVVFRLLYFTGLDDRLDGWVRGLAEDGGFVARVLEAELGGLQEQPETLLELGMWKAAFFGGATQYSSPQGSASVAEAPSGGLYFEADKADTAVADEAAQDGDASAPVGSSYTLLDLPEPEDVSVFYEESYVTMKNNTSFSVDIKALLSGELELGENPTVLIIHSHSSESYTPDAENMYVESDPSRTEDTSYNVIRVGDELRSVLEERGYTVIHDRGLYDYPSYQGSYLRSQAAMESYLEQYPELSVIIDLHRDALEDDSGKELGTTFETDGGVSAQIALVMCTGEDGLEHPDWRENLSFALRIQAVMEARYDGLARPLSLRGERFNQQVSTGSILVEVGMSGNTLPEALNAARLFGGCLADVLDTSVEAGSD